MFANLFPPRSRRPPTDYDHAFVEAVNVRQSEPRDLRLEKIILLCWGLIAVKHVAVIWAVHHYAVPFHQLWVNAPTFLLGLLATLVYYLRELREFLIGEFRFSILTDQPRPPWPSPFQNPQSKSKMAHVPGLRSNYDKIGRLVYVGRLLDKIRLHAAGRLPADYHANLGLGFDGRACAFLRVPYAELKARTLAGGTDEEILAWCFARGGARSDDECLWWNNFMMKRGWRDEATSTLRQRVKEFGLEGKPIETFFDLNEYDEGRDPVGTSAWLK